MADFEVEKLRKLAETELIIIRGAMSQISAILEGLEAWEQNITRQFDEATVKNDSA